MSGWEGAAPTYCLDNLDFSILDNYETSDLEYCTGQRAEATVC